MYVHHIVRVNPLFRLGFMVMGNYLKNIQVEFMKNYVFHVGASLRQVIIKNK